jgi:uncharacterized protein
LKTLHPAFRQIDHRLWPLPETKWIWKQRWDNLLFLHWPIEVKEIRDLIPAELDVDTFDGMAWLAIVPFDMKGVTKRGWPAPKLFCDFPEINVRTYVKIGGKPGVWFFSLDITSGLGVWVARNFFNLPYFKAKIDVDVPGNEINYFHERGAKVFDATYVPGEFVTFEPGSFESWSTERYSLYSQSKSGTLFRGEVHHPKWPLQHADLAVRRNTLLDEFNVGERHPSILFSKSLDVVVFPLERL